MDVAVIGFTGGPWTLMTYMLGEMGGGGGGAFAKAKKWLYCYPEAAKKLLDGISNAVADFLIAQAQAGAHIVQVFDSWAGSLSPDDFDKWEAPALRQVGLEFFCLALRSFGTTLSAAPRHSRWRSDSNKRAQTSP